jgi:hypothetical protein
VLWDHEFAEEVQDQYQNFYELMVGLDLEHMKMEI